MSRNLYSVLGLSRDAETQEIRTAYKQLAKEHHPDKGGDPEKFKELSEAHEVLSDDSRRRLYDMTGSISEQEHAQAQQSPFGGMPGGMPHGMFSQMFGGMFPGGQGGQSFAQGMNSAMPQRRREGKGPGKNQEIPLQLDDYYKGRELNVKLGRQCFCKGCKGTGGASTKACDQCKGRGVLNQMINMGPIQMMAQTPCPPCGGKGEQVLGKCVTCQGRGMTHEEKTMKIIVEPGMMPGNTIVFQGMCSDHPSFTEAGDVTVILKDADEENADTALWSREGTRLKTTVTVSLTESLLGTIKVIKGHPGYPNGLPIDIAVGTQNLWVGTFPGLGMPVRGTPRHGEAVITVLVVPTPEEVQALKTNAILLKTCLPALAPGPGFDGPVSLNQGKWTA
jgi:DnaJ family protein A protein 2